MLWVFLFIEVKYLNQGVMLQQMIEIYKVQGKRIIISLIITTCFFQIISILSHADLTNLTKAASLKARSCRLCRVFTIRMASTSVASALREIREICVRIKFLWEKNLLDIDY